MTRTGAALALVLTATQSPAPGPAVPIVAPQALRAHIEFLADDLLEGRATGSEGYALAARYVAAQFRLAGLEVTFQEVPLRSAEVDPARSFVRLLVPGHGTTELKHGGQALVSPSFLRAEDEVEAPVTFVGYGVSAPDLGHDDYAGVDVRGRIVAHFSGAPMRFPDVLRAHHSSPRLKAETAAARGAVGVLILGMPEEYAQMPWETFARRARAPGMRWRREERVQGAVATLRGAALLAPNASDRVLSGSGRRASDVYAKVAAGERDPFATGARAVIRTVSRQRDLSSPNVVGLLRGSGLEQETVAYTAHLDHLGRDESLPGDTIFNGAVDNAAGVAALIEIARAFAARPQPPRRSVAFVAVTAEEQGLLGSDYFAEFPPVPPVVANINIDGLGLLLPSADVVGIGGDSSTLGETLQRAAAELGFKVSPDPMPEQVLFIRSDQYSFVRRGVPGVFVNAGFTPRDGSEDLGGRFREWLRTRYHTPSDDTAQALDLAAGARLARLNLLLGLMVADQPARPLWRPGDFFGRSGAR